MFYLKYHIVDPAPKCAVWTNAWSVLFKIQCTVSLISVHIPARTKLTINYYIFENIGNSSERVCVCWILMDRRWGASGHKPRGSLAVV